MSSRLIAQASLLAPVAGAAIGYALAQLHHYVRGWRRARQARNAPRPRIIPPEFDRSRQLRRQFSRGFAQAMTRKGGH